MSGGSISGLLGIVSPVDAAIVKKALGRPRVLTDKQSREILDDFLACKSEREKQLGRPMKDIEMLTERAKVFLKDRERRISKATAFAKRLAKDISRYRHRHGIPVWNKSQKVGNKR